MLYFKHNYMIINNEQILAKYLTFYINGITKGESNGR